jgi:hypothetical protein
MATKQDRICAYFAAPLFNEMERGYNNHVTRQLEEYVDVFLPQRDGGLLMQYVKEGISPDGAVRRLVGIEVGVVSGVFNLESPGVDAPGWRLRHEEAYHAA